MATTLPPRPEDVVSGGGTFSSCLLRAIRRPHHPRPASASTGAGGGGGGERVVDTAGVVAGLDASPEEDPDASWFAQAVSRSTSSDAANQDALEAAGGFAADEEAGPTAPEGGAEGAADGFVRGEGGARDGATRGDGEEEEDWTPHHVSYPLLRSTLGFFSVRRAHLRAKLRDALNQEPLGGALCGDKSAVRATLSEEEFNLAVNEYAPRAPFVTKAHREARRHSSLDESADGGEEGGAGGFGTQRESSDDLMEYAGQRALGKTPPGGKRRRGRTAAKKDPSGGGGDGGTTGGSGSGGEDLTMADVLASAACAGAVAPSATIDGEPVPNACSPYLRMGSTSTSLLDEPEVTRRLSFLERSELSAVLDREVERAATFYRARIAELAPPRADGGTRPNFVGACLGTDFCGAGAVTEGAAAEAAAAFGDTAALLSRAASADSEDDEDDIVSHAQKQQLSFTEMANEILELQAFVTTNVVVVRQVLIKYDAFARSLGGTPMGSWYQTTRRQRVKGRSSDFRDLLEHSKLRKLTKAYIYEYKKHAEEVENRGEGGIDEWGTPRRKGGRGRLRGLSRAYHRILDAGEELKRKQRLKWRQSAMHLDDEDDEVAGGEGEGGVKAPPSGVPLDGRTRTPQPPPPSVPGTPLIPCPPPDSPLPPLHPTSVVRHRSASTGAGTAATRLSAETPPPEPPLRPPDYAALRSDPDAGEDIAFQVHMFRCIQSKTQRSIEKTYAGRASGAYDTFVSTIREYFLLGSVSDNLSLMPEYLVMRGKSLKSSLLVVARWREARDAARRAGGMGARAAEGGARSWFGTLCGEEQQAASGHPGGAPASSFKAGFALFLNIFACFLYMMNYYIVEPSSTRYANALGCGDAMSGLIIGAMPWAAIFSAVLYSVWSNHNYRAPLLTSGVLLTIGNFLYSTAYRQESIAIALCGRFLTGLGGPRSMNRRYIADTTPLARRTAVNAAFGTATALGAALGPATAIALDQLDLQFDVPWYGAVFINGMTGPGYLMGVLWIVFTLVLACTFEEPERSGLREQIRKESKETAPKGAGVTEYEMSNLDASKKSKLNMVLDQPRRVLDSLGCPTEGGRELCPDCPGRLSLADSGETLDDRNSDSLWKQAKFISAQITPPVRVCMFLLFSKMFTVESVISATSMVTKNRYDWAVQQVGMLGTVVGCLNIPISVFVGWASQYGRINWGLLATVIGTFGRACGDVFITSVGYIDIRQIMNLLFVPSFIILVLDLILIVYNYDSLTA
ncbi:hypothetical protein ACHAWF_011541 [Thalassiosira exigua]